jgi:hypothetical protein
MKKSILFGFVAVFALKAVAQENNLKINLLNAGYGEIRLGYERVLKEKRSLQVNFGMLVPRQLPNYLYDEQLVEDYGGTIDLVNRITGFAGSLEYRMYAGKKDTPRGLYFAPYLKFNRYAVSTSASFG